ncbi:MAG: tetratricopeptide repeat protein [Prevotellaceae bacterium]|jgi:tetratricopeptide (TPR) repeat protein|nr:tetratricopeptide repeat protein [Prevotellaceae bacterium]
MAKKETDKRDEFQSVEQALTTTEAFIEKYQKQILTGIGIIVLTVLAILAFRNFYLRPQEIAAENELYKAENYFSVDSFEVALNGNFEFAGFKEIASKYRLTSSGNVATAYAGICYYKLGEYQHAIKYLSQYDGKDNYLTATVTGLIGDSYVELNETGKAVGYFEKAAGLDNQVTAPIYLKKAGLAYESVNKPDKAVKSFTTIKEKYPQSNEASDIDKYIARIQK